MNKLYFLHIPKTAGMTLSKSISHELKSNGISHYVNNIPPHNKDFNDNIFLSGHFGTYPIEYCSNFEVATVLRDPVERALSNFNYIHSMILERNEYAKLSSISDQLKYYLFEDENFILHRNVQSRFICNPMDFKSISLNEYSGEMHRDKIAKYMMTKHWFVGNEKTDINYAKSQLDSFKIVGTTDKYNIFFKEVSSWFLNKYNLNIPYKENLIINKSFSHYNGENYETKDLKNLLTIKEYDRIIELNNIDYEVYEYAKKR